MRSRRKEEIRDVVRERYGKIVRDGLNTVRIVDLREIEVHRQTHIEGSVPKPLDPVFP